LLGGAVLFWPFRAQAQTENAVPTVGVVLGLANDADSRVRIQAFERGLEETGWSIGKNLRIVYRYSGGDEARLRAYASEFAGMKLDCILGHSTPVVAALVRTIRTTPIVFLAVTDPVGSGFVKSMSRPGGNATGFTVLQSTITGKYLAMLKELSPQVSRVAIIYNPDSAPGAGTFFMQPFIAAAKQFKVEAVVLKVHDPSEIESAVTAFAAVPNRGLIVMPDNFTSLHREQFISLAAKFRLPTVYPYRYFAEEGGLLAYGVDAVDMFRQASDYVSRVLRGAKPAELPVQAPNKFELVINLKTARELGLVVPRILLAGADAVIE
jgi:putative ABC transport system substrate-binding protein